MDYAAILPVLPAALLIGFVAGLRAFMAPAIVSVAASMDMLGRVWGWVFFMQRTYVAAIFVVLALVELVLDQLPSTPRRTAPIQFVTRLLMGGLAGAAIGAARVSLLAGLAAGVLGALVGTLVGFTARRALARLFGNDRPAAVLEDVVAILLGLAAIMIA